MMPAGATSGEPVDGCSTSAQPVNHIASIARTPHRRLVSRQIASTRPPHGGWPRDRRTSAQACGRGGLAERKVLPREPERSPGIVAEREPEYGGMVGERILVTREQFVVAGFRHATPGLSPRGASSTLAGRWCGAGPRPRGAAQNLDVLGGVGAGEQREPAQHANERQVGEPKGHIERSCWLATDGDVEVGLRERADQRRWRGSRHHRPPSATPHGRTVWSGLPLRPGLRTRS
jgi:hypothetical protein